MLAFNWSVNFALRLSFLEMMVLIPKLPSEDLSDSAICEKVLNGETERGERELNDV